MIKSLSIFLFILASLPVCLLSGQKQQLSSLVLPRLKVDNWLMEQGLPVNSIITTAQTTDGWMFFGTEEGLVRFDGNTFFLMNKSNIPGLNVNFISALLGGRDTSLWIGTEGDGLLRYKNNTFVKYNNSNGLADDRIFTLHEDLSGGLWIGTSGGGVNYLTENEILRYDTLNGLASNYIRTFAIDAKGRVWVGTQKGLSVIDNGKIKNNYTKDGLSDDFIEDLAFDKYQNLWIATKSGGLNVLKDGKFTVYTTKDGLTNNSVTSLCFDVYGMLWIGTNGGGIIRMMNGEFYPFTSKDGLSGDLIVNLFEDRERNIWAATSGTGIDRIKKKTIQTLSVKEGLSGDIILPVFEDHAGVLWLGIAGKGLNRIENGKVQTFSHKDGLPDNLILTIFEDFENTLWIGTAGGGLTSYKNNEFTTYTSSNGLSNNVVSALLYDRSGIMWVGTNGGGINRFKNGKFSSLTTKDGLSHDNVTCILEDRKGNLWVGTNNGLNIIRDNKITVLNKKNGLSDDYILSLYEDSDGNLWIGTAGNGLNLIGKSEITQFTTKDGLINEVVLKIIEDDYGYFWISCNKGIYKIKKQDLFDFANLKIKSLNTVSYGKTDGLESVECNGGVSPAGFKTRDGRLLFPTMKGVAIIDLNLMKTVSSYFSPIHIKEFLVDGQVVPINSSLSIPSYSKRLEFRYAALNYSNPGRIKYRYMLKGFDNNWNEGGTIRNAYYTNITAGNYVFKVMASNESGQWDNQSYTELKFRLKPPFYRSLTFYLIVTVFVLLLIFFVVYYFIARFQRNRLKLLVEERTLELHKKMIAQKQTQEELERTNSELTIAKEHAEESDRLKTAFLTNMSHEIRTPMNGILGFVGLLKEPQLTGEEQQEYLGVIERSGARMLNTINDIICISKIESGQMEITVSETNINEQIEFVYTFFKPEAAQKGIQLFYKNGLSQRDAIIKTDSEKIYTILTNLVKNAIKFSEKGSIEFGYDCGLAGRDKACLVSTTPTIIFYVKDNGIGIPKDRQKAIFDRFVQADIADVRAFQGSGLGLSISKAYTEMLGGEIWVESDPDEKSDETGSTFYFTIPYKPEQGEKNE